MTPEHAEEFTQSIAKIVGGGWRQIVLADRLGVPKALGMTREQWVNHHLGRYVKEAAAEQLTANLEPAEDKSDKRLTKLLEALADAATDAGGGP